MSRRAKSKSAAAWLVAVAVAMSGCNVREAADLRLFNAVIDARNAAWAGKPTRRSEVVAARMKVADLKQADARNADLELRKLREELIHLSERRLEIAEWAVEKMAWADQVKSSSTVDQVLSLPELVTMIRHGKRLEPECKTLLADFKDWDRRVKEYGSRRGWTEIPPP